MKNTETFNRARYPLRLLKLLTPGFGGDLTFHRNASTAELGNIRERIRKVESAFNRFFPHPLGAIRSAVVAERVMKHVVPAVRNNDQKPTIFIAMGAGHAELKDFIERARLRRRFLAGLFPLSRYFTGEQMDKITFYEPAGRERAEFHNDSPLPSYPKRTTSKIVRSNARLLRRKLRNIGSRK